MRFLPEFEVSHAGHTASEWLRNAAGLVHLDGLAALVTIEVALVGLIVSWWQLRYMQKRDRELDLRNDWTELHKVMMNFVFKREVLNQAGIIYPLSAESAMAAAGSLHILKAQLDRMPDFPLVETISGFLNDNSQAGQWRSPEFLEQLSVFAQQVALLSRSSAKGKLDEPLLTPDHRDVE